MQGSDCEDRKVCASDDTRSHQITGATLCLKTLVRYPQVSLPTLTEVLSEPYLHLVATLCQIRSSRVA